MKHFLLTLFVFIGWSLLAQKKEVQLLFLENTSGELLERLDYKLTSIKTGAVLYGVDDVFSISEDDGKLRLSVYDDSYKKIDSIIVVEDFLKSRKKRLQITIPIFYEGQVVDGVEVTALYKPEVIFGSDSLHVEDFEVLDDNKLIILTYPKKLVKGSRLVYLVNNEVMFEYIVPSSIVAVELTRDYRGNTYLKAKENLYHILLDARGFALNLVDQEYYSKYISPVHDTLDNHVYISNYSEWYPAFEYYGVDVTDTNFQEITKIEDELMMELYRAEYKWADVRTKLWAWDMESETGIDREIWVGANYFTRSIYYEPLYAPIFLKTDSVIVFDFYKDAIFIYDGDTYHGVDTIPIGFHHLSKRTGWKKRMLQDPISSSIYNMYDDAGYFSLREITISNGGEGRKIPLNYRYCEKISVYNGYVYYTYRPFESIQKKFLYREKLTDCVPR
jgi:hypothetical protein